MENELPAFFITKTANGRSELRHADHLEGRIPKDYDSSLKIIQPGIALISATDGRGTTDGSPNYKKFLCYSFSEKENKSIITTYQVYTFNGHVIVHSWDKDNKESEGLLRKIEMYHVDITPDRTPKKVVSKHIERISGKHLALDSAKLKKMAEKTYFDIFYNIPKAYFIR